MLFSINESLIDNINNIKNENDPLVGVLEYLSNSIIQRKHLFFANRNVLEILKKNSFLSPRARSFYNKIYNNSSELKYYLDIIPKRIEICSIPNSFFISNNNEKVIINVSPEKLQNSSFFENTVLLIEDDNDKHLYEKIALYFIKNSEIKNININFDSRHGGGDNTYKNYNNIQNQEKRLCLCILDSDFKYPNSDFGQTAKNVKTKDDKNYHFCTFITLNVREIENLIPYKLYQVKMSKETLLSDILTDDSFKDVIKFFDFKKGLVAKKLKDKSQESPFSKYWISILKKINKIESYDDIQHLDDNYKIIEGFGDKCLEHILNTINIDEIQLDNILSEEWNRIGKEIMIWCCSKQQHIRTV